MKKIFAILLSLALMLSLAVPAMAAETYSITINNTATGHTYEAYQIFTGDLSEGKLSNVVWGESVDSHEGDATAIVEKMDTAYTGDDKITVDALLAMITLGEEVAATSTQTDGKYVIDGLAAGYYLVKDKDNSLDGKDDAYTQYIVKVVKDVEASPKGNVPQFEKKVKDINDSTDTEMSAWQDSADHDIGDDVPFQLKATLAGNVESYSGAYKVVFHDTLSAGLSFNDDSVKVYVDGKEIKSDKYTVKTSDLEDDCTFEVIINDAKAIGATNNSIITIEYTAELNEDAVIGVEGNPNFAKLEYSNNPNWTPDSDDDENPETPPTPPHW